MKEKIAVIGIGCIFPDAMDFTEYWRNIVERKNSIHDIAGEFWEASDFYDPDPKAKDKCYSTMGATVDPVEFDSMEFGISPMVMQATCTEQLFSLIAARQALIDAGLYGKNAKPFNKERTGVIISAAVGKNAFLLCHRTEESHIRKILLNNGIPEDVTERIVERYKTSLPEWSEDNNPGHIPNVVAGRIANRFDLGGTSCSVDAACASSLASLKFAVDELQNGNCDIMLAGGANLDSHPMSYISFCKTPAMSKKGKITPFDSEADGMILGDGVGIVVLKRLSDAKRDGDKIYAVVRGVGASSDGRAKSIYAPSKEGQVRALNRAYENAEINSETIGLIEAHGTGTSTGDACEISAICEAYKSDASKRDTIIGSVKSQIGHLRMAAGIAGFIKVALALHEKVLPATLNVTNPNKALLNSSLCALSEPKAWIVNENQPVRRAAVSAFGFGGTNYHAVLEEAQTDYKEAYRITKTAMGVMFSAKTKEELISKIKTLKEGMEENPRLWYEDEYRYHKCEKNSVRLAFTAKTKEEVKEKCEMAINLLNKNDKDSWVQKEITYSEKPVEKLGKVTVLFSGQGTQSINMLSEMAIGYPKMRETITEADNVMIKEKATPVSELVYPNCQTEEEKALAQETLLKTANTQPVLATMEAGLYNVAKERGLKADFMIGHSFGELVALWADGVWDFDTLIRTAKERGTYMGAVTDDTAMFAVMADKATIATYIKPFKHIYMANENSPSQTVVSGDAKEMEQLEKKLTEDGIKSVKLKVSAAFHSPYMEEAAKDFRQFLTKQKIGRSTGSVIANCDGKFYPINSPKIVADILQKQLVNPVLFQTSIENAYEKGARVFVEVGSGKVLSNLTKDILGEKEHEIIALCPEKNKDSMTQFEFAMARLAVLGFDIFDDMYRVLPNEEFVLKKTKTSHTVDSGFFILPNVKKAQDDAVEVADPEIIRKNQESMVAAAAKAGIGVPTNVAKKEEKTTKPVVQTTEVKKQATTSMKGTNAVVKQPVYAGDTVADYKTTQALNAEVFSKFMDVQTSQLEAVTNMLKASQAKTETEKKYVMDCVSLFQNNSLKAFQTYFASQTGTAVVMDEAWVQEETTSFVAPEEETTVVEEVVVKEVAIEQPVAKKAIDIHELVMSVISDKTGYPTEMIEVDMEMEADLGIDSIKRVEILSDINKEMGEIFEAEDVENLSTMETISELEEYLETIKDKMPTVEVEETTKTATEKSSVKKGTGSASKEEIEKVLLEAISDKTGYPTDMLELDMELEVDLGVDSIKRVEIFADVNEALSCDLTADDAEALSELADIRSIVEYLAEKM